MRRAWLSLALAGCASTTTAGSTGADAAVDGGECRWSNTEWTLVNEPSKTNTYALLDAVATGDGAMVAWREHDPAHAGSPVRVRRVNDDGSPHPWSAPGRGTRTDVATFAGDATLEFSMVWDGPGARLAMLVGGASDHGNCVFAAYGDATRWQSVDLAAGGGFSRDGCGSLQRTAAGWSLLTAEVRALWGNDLIALADDGHAVGSSALPMTAQPPETTMPRAPVADGFVATWVETTRATPGERVLYARRFDAVGAPRGAPQEIARATGAIRDVQVVEVGGGLLALWRAGDNTLTTGSEVRVRRLSTDGTPGGPAASLAPFAARAESLDAVVRGASVLVVVTSGGETERPMFLALDPGGAPRGEPRLAGTSQEIESLDVARVVATRRGALVLVGYTQMFHGGGVMALPMDCLD